MVQSKLKRKVVGESSRKLQQMILAAAYVIVDVTASVDVAADSYCVECEKQKLYFESIPLIPLWILAALGWLCYNLSE